MCGVSKVPYTDDVLPSDADILPLPDVAERLGIVVTRVHDLLREGRLLAIRRDGIVYVPALLLSDEGIGKHVPGLISVLRDGGYTDSEILSFLYTEDDSLPGRPVDALHGHLAREVMRRAQAMAF
ncbi:DNA-binding protein [Dietzia timorensis]|uniref:DNA-binding protein n=1 Tax=Dietzia timorensis TaxID=499555 RepID=A0A173LIJ8_9ACTN|nr:DNA-binding protein [Dietzia timorensis]